MDGNMERGGNAPGILDMSITYGDSIHRGMMIRYMMGYNMIQWDICLSTLQIPPTNLNVSWRKHHVVGTWRV